MFNNQTNKMKRFIDLSDQICEGTIEFAFYDTVTDAFESIGGNRTWETENEFISDMIDEGRTDEIPRYVGLISNDFK